MSEELTFAGFAAMFRLGPEKITMTKADAVRLAEVAQVASDEIARLRAENARLREAVRQSALEEAAQEMDCACPQRGAVLAKLAKDGPLSHYWPCEKGDDCCALRGAAIRALKGEDND